MRKPIPSEYLPYYADYVNIVQHTNGISALENAKTDTLSHLQNLPVSRGNYRYAPEKWSINDLVQHLIDCEIIFLTRALRIARNDQTPQPGFDEDAYVAAAKADYSNLDQLIILFEQTRNFTISLFNTFAHVEESKGIVNGGEFSVRALAFIITGHNLHHLRILKERYQ